MYDLLKEKCAKNSKLNYEAELEKDMKKVLSVEEIHKIIDESKKCKDMMDKVRVSADNLEMLIDDEMWPLPKYRELLFF